MWMVIALAALCACEMARPLKGDKGIWYRGILERTFMATIARAHQASILAIKDLKLPVIEERVNEVNGRVESCTARDEPIVITLEDLGGTHTRIKVRFGLAGDRDRAAALMNLIETRLNY